MSAMRKIAGYGWKRDLPDHRDRLYALEERVLPTSRLPRTVDLRDYMPPVWDQGHLGSCVSHGVAAVVVAEAQKQGESFADLTNDVAGYSRLFIYYNGRVLEGTPDQDSGLEVRDGIKVVVDTGVPPEADWPYEISKFADKPSDQAYSDATAKALVYRRIVPGGTGAPVHSALAASYPIVFGFSVPSIFEDRSWDPAHEPLPLPGSETGFIGGHCVVLVGYDLGRKTLLVRNSWGAGWGDGGYFEMDQRWIDPAQQLADDFWVVSQMT